MPPPEIYDPVIEACKRDVDRTLLRENLKPGPQQRSEKFQQQMELAFEIHRVAAERKSRR